MYNAIQEFETWLRYKSKYKPSGNLTIQGDGQVHRYHVEGDRAGSKNGAYCLYTDGVPNGYAMNWKDGKDAKELWTYCYSDAEKREYAQSQNDPVKKAQSEADRRERDQREREKKKHQEIKLQKAIANLRAEYQHSRAFCHETGLIQHPYWQKKFETLEGLYYAYLRLNLSASKFPIVRVVNPYEGGICEAGEILVPMVNLETGELQSLIHIPTKANSEGKFRPLNYKDAPQSGVGHWVISPDNSYSEVILVSEGITTAIAVAIMSVLQGRKDSVLSVGGCGNLESACKALRKKYSESKIVIMADNDKPKPDSKDKDKNAGLDTAEKCRELGLADNVKPSPVQGEDWYDELFKRYKEERIEANVE